MSNSKFINSGNYVIGPSSSSISAVALWNDETGTLLKNSNLIADVDKGDLTIEGNLNTKILDMTSNNYTFTLQPNSLQANDIILTLPSSLGNIGDALTLGAGGVLQFSPIMSAGNVSTLETTTLHSYYVPVWDIGVNRQLITHGAVQITTNDFGGGNVDTNLHIDGKGIAGANVYIGENSNTAALYVFGITSIDGDLICENNISTDSFEAVNAQMIQAKTNSLTFEDLSNNPCCILKANGSVSSPVTWFLPLGMPQIGQTLRVTNIFTNPNEIYLGWGA